MMPGMNVKMENVDKCFWCSVAEVWGIQRCGNPGMGRCGCGCGKYVTSSIEGIALEVF